MASVRPLALVALLAATAAHAQPDTTRTDTAGTRADTARGTGLPLAPARTVRLDTDEGSWMSVDVSPDGRTLVFDLLGDLYTLPIGGGDAVPLTSGMAFDAQPRFSPDGRLVVFTSDRDGGDNVWTIDVATRRTRQITRGKANRYQSPEWTPDGSFVVVSRTGGGLGPMKLWMYHRDGGAGTQLVKDAQPLLAGSFRVQTVGAAFGKDPRYVWLAERWGSFEYNAGMPQYRVATFDRQTGRREVRASGYGSAFRPALSPDGRYLVYGSRYETETGLRLRDLATTEERWLAYPVQHDEQESIGTMDVLPGYAFTPDSRAVVASYGGRLWRVPVDSGARPTAIPFRVRTELALGPKVAFRYRVADTAQFTVRQVRDAVPSPDGRRLAFVALDRLYVMDYPGGTPRQLDDVPGNEAQPAWSPDGRWLAYVAWTREGGRLYKAPSAGGRPVQLTPGNALYQQPAWSPDGRRVVAMRSAAQAYRESGAVGAPPELVWVPAGGGPATFIAGAEGRSGPHFTTDSSRIYLYGSAAGLVSIRWDGSDQRVHLKVTGNRFPEPAPGGPTAAPAGVVRMSPRGDQALVQLANDLYLVPVPFAGEAPTLGLADTSSAELPARRLTDVGGQFPAWGAGGRRVHWSIGNAHFVYDLDRARQVDDSLELAREQAREGARERARAGGAPADSAAQGAARTPGDSGAAPRPAPAADPRGYQPAETRIRLLARRDAPSGTVVLRGARVITMNGAEVLERADVLVRDNRIAAVGASGAVAVPDGARVIDVTGKTVLPGYVDTHAHLRVQQGVHTQPWSYMANLAYGVTTARDPQTGTTDVLSYEDAVLSGAAVGPRIYSTGPGVFGGGYAPALGEELRSLDHARRVMRRYSRYYDTKTLKMYLAGNRQQRQWIIQAAREEGLMPTTEGALDFRLDLTMALDGYSGQEHALPVFPLYRDVIQLFAESGIAYTPTFIVDYNGPWGENYYYETENVYGDAKLRRFTPYEVLASVSRRRVRGQYGGGNAGGWFMKEEYNYPRQARIANAILKAGGLVGVGSHGQLQGLGYHWELWMVQSGGMTPHDALRCATVLGARALGLEDDLGTVAAGKLADLVVLDANPLDDVRNSKTVRMVMKNGRLYDGDTLDELWPRQRKMPPVPGTAARPDVMAGAAGAP